MTIDKIEKCSSKVPSWSNLLKDKVLYVEIKALLLVGILYTGYKKSIKSKYYFKTSSESKM